MFTDCRLQQSNHSVCFFICQVHQHLIGRSITFPWMPPSPSTKLTEPMVLNQTAPAASLTAIASKFYSDRCPKTMMISSSGHVHGDRWLFHCWTRVTHTKQQMSKQTSITTNSERMFTGGEGPAQNMSCKIYWGMWGHFESINHIFNS